MRNKKSRNVGITKNLVFFASPCTKNWVKQQQQYKQEENDLWSTLTIFKTTIFILPLRLPLEEIGHHHPIGLLAVEDLVEQLHLALPVGLYLEHRGDVAASIAVVVGWNGGQMNR